MSQFSIKNEEELLDKLMSIISTYQIPSDSSVASCISRYQSPFTWMLKCPFHLCLGVSGGVVVQVSSAYLFVYSVGVVMSGLWRNRHHRLIFGLACPRVEPSKCHCDSGLESCRLIPSQETNFVSLGPDCQSVYCRNIRPF